MKQEKTFAYNIMKDAHMFYFLQSVPKVKELIATGLYKIDGNKLIEIESKDFVELDGFVAEKVKEGVLNIRDQNEEFNRIVQSEKFKAFEEERERVRKMRVGNSMNASRTKETPKNTEYANIKGLKEFLGKKTK